MNYTTACAPPSTVYLSMVLTEARQETVPVVSTSYVTPSVTNGINGIFPFAVISGSTTWLRGVPPTNAAVVWETPSTITVEPTVVTDVAVMAAPTSSSESNEMVIITSTNTNFVTIALPAAPLESAPGAVASSIDCAAADVTCTLTVTKTRHEGVPTALLQEDASSPAMTASVQDNGMSSPDSTTTILRTLTDTETRTITMTRKRKNSTTATVLATTMAIPSASSAPTGSVLLGASNSSEASPASAGTGTVPSQSGPLASSFGNFPQSSSSTQGSNSSATSEVASAETTTGQVAPANTTTYPSTGIPVTTTRNFYPNTTCTAAPTQGPAENSTQVAAETLAPSPASTSAVLSLPMQSSNTSTKSIRYPKPYGAVRATSAPAGPSMTSDSDTASAPLASPLGSVPSLTPANQTNTTSTVTVFNATDTNTLTTDKTRPVSVYVMEYGGRSRASSSPVLLITESPRAPSFSEFNTAAETATSAAPSTLQTTVRRARLLV
jgi:hypothetical protein